MTSPIWIWKMEAERRQPTVAVLLGADGRLMLNTVLRLIRQQDQTPVNHAE